MSCPNAESLQVAESREHVLFGMSTFNSYYSEERIRQLVQWGHENFQSMHFFIPGKLACHTLQALGYCEAAAEQKAFKAYRENVRKTKRALISLNYSEAEADSMILDWDLAAYDGYSAFHQETREAFECDADMKNEFFNLSFEILKKRKNSLPLDLISDQQIRLGGKYLIDEIPLLIHSASLLNKRSSVFCYHQNAPAFDRLFQNVYSIKVPANQGLLTLRPDMAKSRVGDRTYNETLGRDGFVDNIWATSRT